MARPLHASVASRLLVVRWGVPRLSPYLHDLGTRLFSVARVRQEMSDVSHTLLTLAGDLEREDRPVTTRDLARVTRLCGRLGLVILTHSQMSEE